MKSLMTTCCALLVSIFAFAQNADPILGKWQNPSGEGKIEIYKKGDKYFGKLYWIKDANKKDEKNPDAKLRNRKIQGLEILSGFTRDGQNYSGGQIYDPKSGKTYSCKMTVKGPDKLDIRGYLGVSLLGRTETWKRIE
ncbi:uncharacterized protein (DUF2147 family) [Sphingobacterium allocomposti]|uniref:Uncharacterized protein (DUF2147 family) n=1 Tax=Sphingobacterium allocomposti TaxID=415956 RepID=A0A5S5D837_9SPHI|nr:DUF2147 domain-containing protein [Sphingobacterium composti Yoo et al. 2007 non Ten et al. 2007]TYP91835.1 uncharacterized protein (DUF2147 family) [Sphingobacterium composti Yoo et al. 2007 non Ten et al. 2007]